MTSGVFGRRLRQAREAAGLTQREAGQALDMSNANLSAYELDKREPDYDTLKKLAAFYRCSVDYLLGRTDDPTPPQQEDPRAEAGVDEIRRILLGQGMKPESVDALMVLIRESLPEKPPANE